MEQIRWGSEEHLSQPPFVALRWLHVNLPFNSLSSIDLKQGWEVEEGKRALQERMSGALTVVQRFSPERLSGNLIYATALYFINEQL